MYYSSMGGGGSRRRKPKDKEENPTLSEHPDLGELTDRYGESHESPRADPIHVQHPPKRMPRPKKLLSALDQRLARIETLKGEASNIMGRTGEASAVVERELFGIRDGVVVHIRSLGPKK